MFDEERSHMVESRLKIRGIKDENVLKSMNRVPRHAFVPKPLEDMAYNDRPLPIGGGQTISHM